ncbi:MAG: DUF1926 domain-containing protein [Chitinispirillaceae bacterium]|nr:DUF1926 domain-containing protein [Chitinispirillaceae bacterium]
MRRNALALLLHPFKNGLLPRAALKESLGRFFEALFAMLQSFPQVRFNLVIPGYLLESADPLLLARLRDCCKKNFVELVCTGYTEPFLSLSPPELTIQNVRFGLRIFEELTGKPSRGFLPPFSNWEPSLIAELRAMGLRYTLLSNELFSDDTKTACGYWVAEHTGSSIGLIGTHVLNHANPPADFIDWLRLTFENGSEAVSEPFIVLHYLLPLCAEKTDDALNYLQSTVREIDKHLLTYQPVCFSDFLNSTGPLGLQYIPTSLQIGRRGSVDLHFLNYLFSFDQIGFLQRKLLDIYDRLGTPEGKRSADALLRDLFFVQDINRFLPGRDAGFEIAADRRASYARLIAIDREIHAQKKSNGGRVRITDFLRNGGKIIILSNNSVKTFIDPHNGGQIIGFDFRRRLINLCGVYNPSRRPQPDIIVPGASRTWFLDRILPDIGNEPESDGWLTGDTADFQSADFDHKIRKTATGITVSLVRAGSFSVGDKPCPLHLEKVFGLERESAELIFIYQFSNPSLMAYRFTFSTEFHFFLPGVADGSACLLAGKSSYDHIGRRTLRLPALTAWSIADRCGGIRLQLQAQKPLTFWCLPADAPAGSPEGVRIVLTSAVALDPSSCYTVTGKLCCGSIKKTAGEELTDAI